VQGGTWKPIRLKKVNYSEKAKMQAIADCKTRTELHDWYSGVYKWLLREGRMDEFFPIQQNFNNKGE